VGFGKGGGVVDVYRKHDWSSFFLWILISRPVFSILHLDISFGFSFSSRTIPFRCISFTFFDSLFHRSGRVALKQRLSTYSWSRMFFDCGRSVDLQLSHILTIGRWEVSGICLGLRRVKSWLDDDNHYDDDRQDDLEDVCIG